MTKPYSHYRPEPDRWFPPVPAHWRDAPVWTLFTREARKGFPGEPLLSVYRDHGVVPKDSRADNFNRASEDLSTYQLVEPGDLVVNKMKAWQGSLSISKYRGIVSPAYFVYRPHHRADERFLHHLLRSQPLIGAYIGMSKGVRVSQWDLEPQNFSRLKLALPPLAEQRAIADYLDRETAKIDTLIEEQQRLVEMLRERRKSVIDRQFDVAAPNTRLRHACVDVVDCPHTTPEVDDDGEYEAVRTASVRDGKYRSGHGLRVSRETWFARNAGGAPAMGDILFTREAPAGEACMVPGENVCLGQRMVLLRIDSEVCNGEFLLWQIYTDRIQDHLRLSANGSTVGNVRLPVLRSTPVWLPHLDEQRRIAAYLNEQTSKIDGLIAESERFIELSRERRSALITAAVTGQIDVRGEAA